MSSRRCRLGRPHSQAPNPSAVVAARLSDADAKAIRLTCHDHRRRRGGVGAAVLALGSTDTTGTPAATPTLTGESTAQSAGFTPKKSDFEIEIKILEKTCFGSTGCSISYRIKPKYVGTQELPDVGTVEVSYRVTGDESGPRQNTFEIVGGQAEFDQEEFAGTRSSGTVLKAKVIEVSYTAS